MHKIVWRFGLLSGVVLGGLLAASVPWMRSESIDFDQAALFGYASMVAAFVFVFLGIRAYRNEVGDGSLGFGRGLAVGALITVVAATVYVVTWQVLHTVFIPDFVERYADHSLAAMRADGATAEVIRRAEEDMARFATLYANPFFRVGITYLEVIPVGLVVSAVSAVVLRRSKA